MVFSAPSVQHTQQKRTLGAWWLPCRLRGVASRIVEKWTDSFAKHPHKGSGMCRRDILFGPPPPEMGFPINCDCSLGLRCLETGSNCVQLHDRRGYFLWVASLKRLQKTSLLAFPIFFWSLWLFRVFRASLRFSSAVPTRVSALARDRAEAPPQVPMGLNERKADAFLTGLSASGV